MQFAKENLYIRLRRKIKEPRKFKVPNKKKKQFSDFIPHPFENHFNKQAFKRKREQGRERHKA